MTAKTILVQLNHKIATFEHLSKRLVLVLQDCLLDYMRREFPHSITSRVYVAATRCSFIPTNSAGKELPTH